MLDFRHRKSGIEESLSVESKAFNDRWIDRLTEIRREHRSLDACFPDIGEKIFPPRLIRIRRRKTVLDHGAHIGQLLLLFGGEALGRKLGVRDDNLLHTHFASCGNDLEDFIASEMAGGQNYVVLRYALQTKPRRLDDVAVGIHRRERRR